MTKKEYCLCGEDITKRYLDHPPLSQFSKEMKKEESEDWAEFGGIIEAVVASGL